MAKRKTLMEELREDVARDPERNAAYQREVARLRLANQILELRQRLGLSQAELAKIAAATGSRLDVRLVPKAVTKRK